MTIVSHGTYGNHGTNAFKSSVSSVRDYIMIAGHSEVLSQTFRTSFVPVWMNYVRSSLGDEVFDESRWFLEEGTRS
jgi:hypothetical protein